jgi:prevent-host-death family protein
VQDLRGQALSTVASVGIDPSYVRSYEEHYRVLHRYADCYSSIYLRLLTMVTNHGTKYQRRSYFMQEIAISKFKATCLAVLERVRRTRQPVRVTRFGDPVAEVVPPSAKPRKKHWLGSMAGTGQIVGDIVSPASDEKDWDALNS